MATPPNPNQLIALTTFIENYRECVETLPDDIQRSISQLRELDQLYRAKLSQTSHLLDLYNTEKDPSTKRKYLTKIQRCLVRSQEYGDEKLQLVSQIVDMGENRNQLIGKFAEEMDAPTRMDSPSLGKTNNIGLLFNDNGAERVSKRPRRQRNFDKFETLAKVAKAEASSAKKEKKVKEKEEKTPKSEKKEKTTEKVEVSDPTPVPSTSSTTDSPKKSNETNKKGSDSTKKKVKEGKKEIKKKKPGKKKKKEKEATPDDIPIDPDEPTYCLCNQVSYGEMIGCDNEECSIEWFHFNCVNLTTKPKGKWYCPSCIAERKEKGKK